jgi:serine protease Do
MKFTRLIVSTAVVVSVVVAWESFRDDVCSFVKDITGQPVAADGKKGHERKRHSKKKANKKGEDEVISAHESMAKDDDQETPSKEDASKEPTEKKEATEEKETPEEKKAQEEKDAAEKKEATEGKKVSGDKDVPREEAEKKEEEEAPKVKEAPSNPDVKVTFEKGFSAIAAEMKHSVVNIAVQSESEQERTRSPFDFFGGEFFGGSFFGDDLFDFFGGGPLGQRGHRSPKRKRKVVSLGSGFIVAVANDKVYIATNYHVVEKAKKIVIYLTDKTELRAEVHATDPRTDIAVLVINMKGLKFDKSKLKAVTWGDSETLLEGHYALAVGNPFGLGCSFAAGIISAVGRGLPKSESDSIVDCYIQHDAQINMGNSGGCLVDVFGHVIGINNAIYSTSANGGNIGIGFAIPSVIAKQVVSQLIKSKRTYRGWLGVVVHPITASQAESVGLLKESSSEMLDSSKVYGAFVAKVVKDGPGEKAGIKERDIVLEVDGRKISDEYSLQKAISAAEIGSSIKVKVWRQSESDAWGDVSLTVKIGDFEKAKESGAMDEENDEAGPKGGQEAEVESLGITVASVPKGHTRLPAEVKVMVVKVDESAASPFYGPVFLPGDGILMVKGKKVSSPKQFKQAIKAQESAKRPIPIVIYRGGSVMLVATTPNTDRPKEGDGD